MEIATLRELYASELEDLYNCERRLVKILPRAIRFAFSKLFEEVFRTHMKEAKIRLERLKIRYGDLKERTNREFELTDETIERLIASGDSAKEVVEALKLSGEELRTMTGSTDLDPE